MIDEESVSSSSTNRRRKASAALALCIIAVCFAFLGIDMESRSLKSVYLVLATSLNQQVTFSQQRHTSPSSTSLVKGNRRPPISQLVDGNDMRIINNDVQFLLDFAIIAHPKCGTTSLLKWIGHHDEVQMHEHEVHSLTNNKPAELVSLMYDLPPGSNYKRGYKAPNDLRSDDALQAIQSYWPQTKLIIGLRHPVKWMESFYNFRSRQGRRVPSDEVMRGFELPEQVQFHVNLANLGKTNITAREARLLGPERRIRRHQLINKVFLYEISQPSDTNETRSTRFRKDLSNFIGLSTPLDPLERENSTTFHYAIDICDEEYSGLRAKLVENGKDAAVWIRKYFLPLSDVTVSSPEYFDELLQSWSVDPCDEA